MYRRQDVYSKAVLKHLLKQPRTHVEGVQEAAAAEAIIKMLVASRLQSGQTRSKGLRVEDICGPRFKVVREGGQVVRSAPRPGIMTRTFDCGTTTRSLWPGILVEGTGSMADTAM